MKENILCRYTVDKVVSLYEKFGERTLSNLRQKNLNNVDFSIISNNCWGGHVYRHFGIQYNSPTVGMYFFSDEYIKLLRDIEKNIYLPLSFISPYESKYKDELVRKNQTNVPIGLLGDEIEVVFLHYHSIDEARDKWIRRRDRINFNNLIVKNSEMNLCTLSHLVEFDQMEYRKKVLFVSQKYPELDNYSVVKRYSKHGEVQNDTTYYASQINLTDLING